MAETITIEVSDDVAAWLDREAAERNTPASVIVGEMLERARLGDDYWRAYEDWKSHRPFGITGAANRMSRDEVHERR